MNDSETEIPIIETAWKCFTYCSKDGQVKLQYPNASELSNLIRFPRLPYTNPYYLEKFRIRPQVYDPDSQILLQQRSNLVVEYWVNSPLNEYETHLLEGVTDSDRRAFLIFVMGVIFYQSHILPVWKIDPVSNNAFMSVMRGLSIKEWMPESQSFRDKYEHLDWKMWDRDKRESNAITERFIFNKEINEILICRLVLTGDIKNVAYDSYDRICSEYRRHIKWKERQPQTTRDSINQVLTQCLFCYRFHLQDSKIRRSRDCPICKGQPGKTQYQKWKRHIEKLKESERIDFNQSDVPLLAF